MPAPCIDESDRVSVARTHPGAPGGGVALRILNPDGSEGEKWALGLSALPLAVAAHGLAVALVPASGQESVQVVPSDVEGFLGPQTRVVLDGAEEFVRGLDLRRVSRFRGIRTGCSSRPHPITRERAGLRSLYHARLAHQSSSALELAGDVTRRALKH